jgi:hypothetical protein
MKLKKHIVLGLIFGLTIGIFGALILFNNPFIKIVAQATTNNNNWVNVGECIANNCGTSEGLQNQSKTTPGYTTPIVCEKVCPSIQFSASHQVVDVAAHKEHRHCVSETWGRCWAWGEWSDGNVHGGGLKESRDIPATYKTETFGPISVQYGEKSSDENHCHRPTGKSLNVPSWAISEFNTLNRELNTEDANCEIAVDLTPTPTEEPTPTEQPRQVDLWNCSMNNSCPYVATAPQCTDGNTIKLPANPHVIRKGSQAIVNWFETEGDEANIYFKEVDSNVWTHAVRDIKVTGGYASVTINDLKPNLGYTFGIEQKRGCAGGQLVIAVIVDGPESQTFGFSYWEWGK